jgi:hypothetical protein
MIKWPDMRGSLCAISLSFMSGFDKTEAVRIILHLIALLSFIAIPLAESQTLTPSPSPAGEETDCGLFSWVWLYVLLVSANRQETRKVRAVRRSYGFA